MMLPVVLAATMALFHGVVVIGDDPVPGTTVEIKSGDVHLSRVTDARGAFDFGEVPPGAWTLTEFLPGTEPFDHLMCLTAGENFYAMRIAPAEDPYPWTICTDAPRIERISGRVFDQNEHPVAGAIVRFNLEDPVVTGADGRFEVVGKSKNVAQVVVAKPGYRDESWTQCLRGVPVIVHLLRTCDRR